MRQIKRDHARRALRSKTNKVSIRDRPFPTEGTIGHDCFDMLRAGTTMAALVRAIRRRRGNVRYWLWVFRREQHLNFDWRWHEDKETSEVRITWPR